MKSITLKSGNTLEVQPAAFGDSWDLSQLIAGELAIGLPGLKIESLDESAFNQDIDIGKFISVIFRLISSKPVFDAIWPCFAPCLYNGEKVERSTFESEKSRPDFLPCVIEILRINVLPFTKGLDLSFLAKSQAPKSKSGQK